MSFIVVAQKPSFLDIFGRRFDSIITHSLTQLLKAMSKRSWADLLPLPCLKRRKIKNPSAEHDDHDGVDVGAGMDWKYDYHHHWHRHNSSHSWTWENYDHSSSWTSTRIHGTNEEDFSEEYESFHEWWSRVSASTWDGSPWWDADDAPGWSYQANIGWLYFRNDGLCWQYVTGDSTYAHGNGYGFGQWHLVDPSLPSESLDAESTATAAAPVEIEISPAPSDDDATEIA